MSFILYVLFSHPFYIKRLIDFVPFSKFISSFHKIIKPHFKPKLKAQSYHLAFRFRYRTFDTKEETLVY